VDEDTKQSQLFSMDLENIETLLSESELQLELTEEHLLHYLDLDIVSEYLICTLCEYYSSNFALVKELKMCIEYNAQIDRDDKKELILTAQNIKILETTALSRYILIRQLSDYNISTYMN
tara:strand:+ start:22459 stop:22818 length:360 start_codon:yes stop_codon:yes gene_type:complete